MALFLLANPIHLNDQSGSFEVVNEEGTVKHQLKEDAGNHVFAKTYGNYIWVRLALTPEKDGSTSDHLDIDIWNFSGPGNYLPANPKANKRDGKRWNVWWHQSDKVFVNQANAKECSLNITEEGGILIGKFGCPNLTTDKGEGQVSIANGRFRIKPEPGNTK